MKRQLILTLSALAAVCQALASPVNPLLGDKYSLFEQPSLVRGQRITLGVIGNDRDSFKLGEYTGLREDGVYGLGAFFSGGEWFESDINYRLEGRDLGLESRQILGRFGFARGIRLDVAYRELPHYELDSILIPFHRRQSLAAAGRLGRRQRRRRFHRPGRRPGGDGYPHQAQARGGGASGPP